MAVESGWELPSSKRPRIPDTPPPVPPVKEDIDRPLWSVMIPVYNCARYLEQALQHVLLQDPGPDKMQIEVVDDASTDADVRELVHRVGKGRVLYFRQQENVGSLWNFHTCIERARGRWVHILHGDDLVSHGFYERMQRLFQRWPGLGAAFCRYSYMDETGRVLYCQDAEMDQEGVLADWALKLAERQRIQYVAMVVKRDVYEKLGGFYGVEYGEDWEMWMRIAANYDTGYIPDVLASYRRHRSSISGKSFATGRNLSSLDWVMHRIGAFLPAGRREEVRRKSRRFYAHYGMRIASSLWNDYKDRKAALAQAAAAWNMWGDVALAYKIMKLYTRITLNL